jgi:hypothetical protein
VESAQDLRIAARRARHEADELHRLAARLDASHAHELGLLGGDRTWFGPTAAAFQDAVRRCRQELDAAAADLRRHAGALDVDAQELDRSAAHADLAMGR